MASFRAIAIVAIAAPFLPFNLHPKAPMAMFLLFISPV